MSVIIKQEGVCRSIVNVGTIGHVDHQPRRILVVDDGRGIGHRIAKMIDMTGIEVVSESEYRAIVDAPKPKPAKRITASDLERIESAEAKRQRRIERNQQKEPRP